MTDAYGFCYGSLIFPVSTCLFTWFLESLFQTADQHVEELYEKLRVIQEHQQKHQINNKK